MAAPLAPAAQARAGRDHGAAAGPSAELNAARDYFRIEDDAGERYSRVGLSLRRHPVAFLRNGLAQRRIVTCAEAMAPRDPRWCEVAGLVLVRQRPGSAKGVMFITLEDEIGIANLMVWPKVFEAHRRIILGAGMRCAVVCSARARWFTLLHMVSSIYRASLEAWATERAPSRCRTRGATNFITAARRGIRATRNRRALQFRSPATCSVAICISTRSG